MRRFICESDSCNEAQLCKFSCGHVEQVPAQPETCVRAMRGDLYCYFPRELEAAERDAAGQDNGRHRGATILCYREVVGEPQRFGQRAATCACRVVIALRTFSSRGPFGSSVR